MDREIVLNMLMRLTGEQRLTTAPVVQPRSAPTDEHARPPNVCLEYATIQYTF